MFSRTKRFNSSTLPPSRPRVARRNVRIGARRTTVKMEVRMWEALEQICRETGHSVDGICTDIEKLPQSRTNLTSELRLFILDYFRDGAVRAGGHC